MRSRTITIATLALASTISSTLAEDCSKLLDASARLACFDKQAKSGSAKAATKRPAADPFAEAKAAMTKKLRDPESARFSDLYEAAQGPDKAICGMVNSKNAMGGYVGATGFIYEPSIKRATMMFSGGSDPEYTTAAAAAYCMKCSPDPRSDQKIIDHCASLIGAAGFRSR